MYIGVRKDSSGRDVVALVLLLEAIERVNIYYNILWNRELRQASVEDKHVLGPINSSRVYEAGQLFPILLDVNDLRTYYYTHLRQ